MVKVLLIKAFVLLSIAQQSNLTLPSDNILIWNDTVYHVYPPITPMEEYHEIFSLQFDADTCGTDVDNSKKMFVLEIKNDSLYCILIKNCAKLNVGDSFDKNALELGSKMWIGNYTGTFYCGHGNGSFKYGFPYILYEKEITVCVEKGICKKCILNTSVDSKYGDINTLTNFVYSNLNFDNLDTLCIDDNATTYVGYDIDSTGHLHNMIVLKSSGNDAFDNEVVRVVCLITQVSVSYFKGEYFPKKSVIPVSYKIWKKYKKE